LRFFQPSELANSAKRASASGCFESGHFGTDLLGVFGGRLQLRPKVLDLNAEGLLETFCTQKFFQKFPVCRNLPLEVCLEVRKLATSPSWKAPRSATNR
jgi:hypothetical protein